MGHYDSSFDFDNAEKIERERKKIIGEITELISKKKNVNELRQIKMLVKNIDKVNDFLLIVERLNIIKP